MWITMINTNGLRSIGLHSIFRNHYQIGMERKACSQFLGAELHVEENSTFDPGNSQEKEKKKNLVFL